MSRDYMTGADMVVRMRENKTPAKKERKTTEKIHMASFWWLYDKKTERGCVPYRTLVNSVLEYAETFRLDDETIAALKRTSSALESEYQRKKEQEKKRIERRRQEKIDNTYPLVMEVLNKKGYCSFDSFWYSDTMEKYRGNPKEVKKLVANASSFISMAEKIAEQHPDTVRVGYCPCTIYTVDYLKEKYNI